jgi:hypothetical protein
MDLYPIWNKHVEDCLINQYRAITYKKNSTSKILVFLRDEFIHVRNTYDGSSTLAETNTKEIEDTYVNTWRKYRHYVKN